MAHRKALFRRLTVGLCFGLPWLAGCAAFHPMNGVPARYLPDDMKVGQRNGKRTIDLSLLRQNWNGIHQVDAGDVLGIYIGGVLGKIDENPQVQLSTNSDYQPAAGVPVTVREDGTISLPMVGALNVRGKTIRETEEVIRSAYTNHAAGKEFLKPERERILVSLQRARQTRVLVVRQDSRNEPLANAAAGMLNIGTAKRGTGKVVSLPAYRNDILNALIATDGLPGLDAENAVYIIRSQPNALGQNPGWPNNVDPAELIRQTKETKTPVIRGQNSDSFDYRTQYQPNRSRDAASNPDQVNDPTWDYRRTPAINSQPQRTSPFSNDDGNRDRRLPTKKIGQMAIDAQIDPDQNSLNQPQSQQDSSFNTVDRVGYQNAQPWGGGQNGTAAPWNGGNAQQVPYSPTPLQNPIPSAQPALPPMPPAGNGSQPAVQGSLNQPFWQGQQPIPSPQPMNWPQQPAVGGPPAGPLPGQGYSLPDSNAPAIDGLLPGVPAADAAEFDQRYGTGIQDIGLVDGRRIIRIPIRLGPDEHVDINPQDIILHDGDIVFIESRDTEVFFTGGLLGGGQYTLPRDFDLDILQALSIAGSRMGSSGAARQIGGVSALNSDVTISPSNVVIIRKLPEGGEIPIKVDLYRARNDLSERIIVQPGDYIYLQYTKCEAIAAFIDRHLLEGALFGLFAQQLNRPTN